MPSNVIWLKIIKFKYPNAACLKEHFNVFDTKKLEVINKLCRSPRYREVNLGKGITGILSSKQVLVQEGARRNNPKLYDLWMSFMNNEGKLSPKGLITTIFGRTLRNTFKEVSSRIVMMEVNYDHIKDLLKNVEESSLSSHEYAGLISNLEKRVASEFINSDLPLMSFSFYQNAYRRVSDLEKYLNAKNLLMIGMGRVPMTLIYASQNGLAEKSLGIDMDPEA